MSDAIDQAAMALMDKMSADGHEVNYTQCREYAALAIAAGRKPMPDLTPEQERRIAQAPKRPWTPPVDTAPDDELAKALWDAVDDKGIRGRLYREDCDYIARVAREYVEQEIPEALDKIGNTWQSRARRMGKRAEEAEAKIERMRAEMLTMERDWKTEVDQLTGKLDESKKASLVWKRLYQRAASRYEKMRADVWITSGSRDKNVEDAANEILERDAELARELLKDDEAELPSDDGDYAAPVLKDFTNKKIGDRVSVIFEGEYLGYAYEVGHHFIKGAFIDAETGKADHYPWTIEVHWSARLD